ncbi:MAG: ParA family protein [Lachnospirales bacterium]
MKVITITNNKGGVGKSTTSSSLAVGLARKGKRVLAIDLDPQGSLTICLGFTEQEKLKVTIKDIIDKIIEDKPIKKGKGILRSTENVDLMPANLRLAGIDITLNDAMSRETVLQTYLEQFENDYDYVILDCGSNLDMLTTNALVCADEVIIPIQAEYLAVVGMEQIFRLISRVKKKLNSKLEVGGILFTMVDFRFNFSNDIIELIKENYGNHINIFKSIIPASVRAKEMSAEGKSIYLHDPKGKVAEAYEKFVMEVLQ